MNYDCESWWFIDVDESPENVGLIPRIGMEKRILTPD